MDALKIVLDAGAMLASFYRETPRFCEKARFDLVSEADREIERFVTDRLRDATGATGIFSEEGGTLADGGNGRWILDPIDGTANFIAGVPYFAVALAREAEGAIVEGYVYNPVAGECYEASASGEATLNGQPIHVSDCDCVASALVGFGFSARMDNIRRYHAEWLHVFEGCRKGMPLIVPSLTLCNVARGRLDAFIDFGCSMEGQAAASLILANAGGALFDYGMGAFDHRTQGVVACAPGLANALRARG